VTATTDLLAFAAAAHRLPDVVRDAAVRLLGDTLAVGAAGADAPGADAILSAARGFGAGDEARLLGTDERLPAPGAAFVNGYRIHCLEWDAVHEPAVVHAMSVVTAALGAAIDRRAKANGACDPDEALVALAIGVDIASGMGIAADSPLSFFRPATAGLIGAAMAVARFDGAPLDHTLGLACSSCAGTMQAHVEGSIALPFQIANAARAAVTASDLAKAGFTGPLDPLEGPFGYFPLFDRGDLARYTCQLGSIWRIGELSTKPFPSGRASHAALGALMEFSGQDVQRIELACPPLIHRLVGRAYHSGMTPAYARLCLPFLAALMLSDGRIDPRRFTPASFSDPALASLAGKVYLIADGNGDENALFPQVLTITLAGGEKTRRAIPHTLGSPQAPLSPTQSAAKLSLARELASAEADPRIFTAPLSYFTEPT
jgi:2-methylcitrate dehydratase PrpD